MPMTDEQLLDYLGCAAESAENKAKILRAITPEKRALYDRMAKLETELSLWQMGLGPKPTGVLIDSVRDVRRRRGWRRAFHP